MSAIRHSLSSHHMPQAGTVMTTPRAREPSDVDLGAAVAPGAGIWDPLPVSVVRDLAPAAGDGYLTEHRNRQRVGFSTTAMPTMGTGRRPHERVGSGKRACSFRKAQAYHLPHERVWRLSA